MNGEDDNGNDGDGKIEFTILKSIYLILPIHVCYVYLMGELSLLHLYHYYCKHYVMFKGINIKNIVLLFSSTL